MNIKNLKRARDIQNDVEALEKIFDAYKEDNLFLELCERETELTDVSLVKIKTHISGYLLKLRDELHEEAKKL